MLLNGDQAMALGALAAGVSIVTSYPGSPSSGTVDHLIEAAKEDPSLYVEWSANERVALEIAIGACIAGCRALVCTKSVGMNVMLDPLMALNLTPVNGGLVILLGDDPGGYGSQNDQDTRSMANLIEMPMLEPATPSQGYAMMLDAFELSERFQLPFIIRETRSFTQQKERFSVAGRRQPTSLPTYKHEPFRYVPVPQNVVEKHCALHGRLDQVRNWAAESGYNHVHGSGEKGVVCTGFTFQKLLDVTGPLSNSGLRVLQLGTLYPLPVVPLVAFLNACSHVLVLEENEPFIERSLKALAYEHGCRAKITGIAEYGLRREGELFRWQIQKALQKYSPDLTPVGDFSEEREHKEQPAKKSYCSNCRYDEVLELLQAAAGSLKRKLVFTGDPGCLVTVAERLDAKYAIGSSVALADGLYRAGVDALPVALIGDSGFFHMTLPAMCNAVHHQGQMLMVVLDNGTTQTSGGQPHPGTDRNALGQRASALSIAKISQACGIDRITTVSLHDPDDRLQREFRQAILQEGLRMVIVKIPGVG